MEEGCLSLPGINMNIERPESVNIIYHDLTGRRHRLRAKELMARLCQHEIDHLNGILMTDHSAVKSQLT
jgi:peptide deformylase